MRTAYHEVTGGVQRLFVIWSFPMADRTSIVSGSAVGRFLSFSKKPFFKEPASFVSDDGLSSVSFSEGVSGRDLFSVKFEAKELRPTRAQVREAMSLLLPVPLESIHESERADWTQKARVLAAKGLNPSIRHGYALFVDEILFVSLSSPSHFFLSSLSSALGSPSLSVSSFLSCPDGDLTAAISMFFSRNVRSSGAALPVSLSSFSGAVFDGGKTKISGSMDSCRPSVLPVLDSLVRVESVDVHVLLKNGRCSLSADLQGICRFDAPSSRGGLPADRIRRRMSDVICAARMWEAELSRLD